MRSRFFGSMPAVVCIVALSGVLGLQCQQMQRPDASYSPVIGEARADSVAVTVISESTSDLARRDPVAFLNHCRTEYDRLAIHDYTCRFTKQELVGDKLTEVQETMVRFREEPYSVDMKWITNATAAKRALYVEDAWTDGQGRRLAWFKPNGALVSLFVPKIQKPVDGPRAKAAARRSLDQFGFRRTLDLIIKYTQRGLEDGVLDLEFVGESGINGRPTFVFERRLPFTGDEEPYPDGLLRFHVDQEWLVPTACFSYADHDGRELLGSYVTTGVQFNVGLNDDDFDPQKIGF